MTTQASAPSTTSRHRTLGLYAICFGFFLVLLDTTALNVAVGSMERELGGTISGLQWIVNAYTIVFASLLLAAGTLGDRYGAKRLYQIGLALFTALSLCCALSPSVGVLIAMRMFQGLGAAIMLPASLALLSHEFPGELERAGAVSFWASIVSLGFAAGPALGGALINFFGWRSIFFINVPVGVVAMLMVHAYTHETTNLRARRIDWAGQGSIALALWALTYALIEAGSVGWAAPRVLAAFAASIALTMLFVLAERRSDAPVLPRALLERPAFTVCVSAGVVLNFGMYGTLFIESLYLQNARHLSPLATGIMILPFTVLPTVTTRAIDRWAPTMHFKPRLIAGCLIAALGGVAMAASVLSPGNGIILLGLGVCGVAMGYIMPAMTTGVLTASPAETAGLASGVLNAGRQVGGAIGVAFMGTLVQMAHDNGMIVSFALLMLTFVAMAWISAAAIPRTALAGGEHRGIAVPE